MRPSKAHFVTSCQQVLALGAVLAVLTPAASVVSLDVVHEAPAHSQALAGTGSARLSAYAREAATPSRVPTAPVDAEVTEVALTPPAGAPGRRVAVAARTQRGPHGATDVVSRPQAVTGYSGVGVTWDPRSGATDEDLSFEVRSRDAGAWSDWTPLEYHDEHAPDPDSPEGRHARPGTEMMFVGHVEDVQLRATSEDAAPPADMRLSVVEPGKAAATARELPELDETEGEGEPELARSASGTSARLAPYTPRPTIYSRAQWGANENLRDKGSLRYFEVHAGFVHHTVNANAYSRAEVPGILRSIYSYHTQSRGWSDVGYNFLVDRFGRIWEGRYGGVDRPVVGAHTLGYNDYSFAMSAIGNFDVAQPSQAMVEAYGSLFAWKLSLHGVDAGSASQVVGPDRFKAINGHRDAGSTACPGRYLYAKIPQIRTLAQEAQQDWSGRDLQSDIAGTPHPDLLVRRAGDKRLFVLPTGGLSSFRKGVVTRGVSGETVVVSPDLTGDGRADLLVRAADGTSRVRPGDGTGRYGSGTDPGTGFARRDLITSVGDLDGDGDGDLVARNGRALNTYLSNGDGGFRRVRTAGDWSAYDLLASTGDVTGDGVTDVLGRDRSGKLWAHPGLGGRRFGDRVAVPGSWGSWAGLSGFGDFTRDGRADLFGIDGQGRGWIVPATGELTFGTPLGPFSKFDGVRLAGATQVSGDPLPDVVVARGTEVRTFAHRGTVDLAPAIRTSVKLRGADALLSAGDWDRDGHGDMIYRRSKGGALFLRQGDGEGGFGEPVRLARGFGRVRLLAAVGDMTGDGWPDLMGQPVGGGVRIYPGDGLDGLRASYLAHSAVSAATQVPVGRWDADGAPDTLFRSGSSLSLYPGNGPGGLTGRRPLGLDVGRFDWVVGVSDLGIGKHSDLVVRERSTGRLYAVPGTRDGFGRPRILGEGAGGYDLVG